MQRLREFLTGMVLLLIAPAATAHAGAIVSADTTRSLLADPVLAGRSGVLNAGGLNSASVTFRVSELTGPAQRAVLRVRVTAGSARALTVRAGQASDPEDGLALPLLPSAPLAVTGVSGPGVWAEFDVTSAVTGAGAVAFTLSAGLTESVELSSREGADPPQLIVAPDDIAAADLAAALDPRAATTLRLKATDDLGRGLNGLDVALSPAPSLGRYLGVYHSRIDGIFVTQLATSQDLVSWTHRADLATHGSQASLAVDPLGGVIVADELDAPDPQYVSNSQLRVRHYASAATLLAGQYDAEKLIARTLAPTAEGTPQVQVVSWGTGPADSVLRIYFHFYRDIDVDRQAVGTLTNFDAWQAQPDAQVNALVDAVGVRGNAGDRTITEVGGRSYSVLEGQLVNGDFGSWRLLLVDRANDEVRLIGARTPAGSYALGNPSVRYLPGPAGADVLFLSAFVFSENSAGGEYDELIAITTQKAIAAAGDQAREPLTRPVGHAPSRHARHRTPRRHRGPRGRA